MIVLCEVLGCPGWLFLGVNLEGPVIFLTCGDLKDLFFFSVLRKSKSTMLHNVRDMSLCHSSAIGTESFAVLTCEMRCFGFC